MLKRFSKKFTNSLPTRFKIGLMMFIGSCIVYMLRSNFSIILIAMTKSEFNWSNHEQNFLLSGYFYGYLLPNLCGGLVAERYGGKIVIFVVLFLSSIITALSPLTASDNIWFLFAARVTLGFLGVSEEFSDKILLKTFLGFLFLHMPQSHLAVGSAKWKGNFCFITLRRIIRHRLHLSPHGLYNQQL